MTTVVVMTDHTQPTAPLVNGDGVAVTDGEDSPFQHNGHVHSSKQMNSPDAQNGIPSIPPQQVYVGSPVVPPDMSGLDNQFQAMGMSHVDHGEELEDHEGSDEHADDGDNDEDPMKLFVGQVRMKMIVAYYLKSSRRDIA